MIKTCEQCGATESTGVIIGFWVVNAKVICLCERCARWYNPDTYPEAKNRQPKGEPG